MVHLLSKFPYILVMYKKATFFVIVVRFYLALVLASTTGVSAQPVIHRFYPASASSGKTVTIEGSGFASANAVSLGGFPAQSFTVVNDTAIRAIVAGGASGEVKVIKGAQTASMPGFFYLEPRIDSLVQRGYSYYYEVIIYGKNFGSRQNIQSIRVAGKNESFRVLSDSVISLTPYNSGCLDDSVIVQTKYHRVATNKLSCKPVITLSAIFPQRAKEGDTISIIGRNFEDIVHVWVGDVKAISYEVVNDTLIRAIPGKGTSTYVEVASKSSYAFIQGYNYSGLVTRKVEPMGGRQGEVIRLSGQLYNNVTQVIVAGTPVQQFQALNDSVILATLNAAGKGAVEVITPNGAYSFQGFNALTINQVLPGVGMPGDTVTFKGKNLRFVNGASFGSSVSTNVTVFGDTLVTIIVPAMPAVNNEALKLFSPYDTLQVMSNWKFTRPATIIDFWPRAARFTEIVTIRGTNLASAQTVYAGNSFLGFVDFKSDTLIKVSVGFGVQSGAIRVTTSNNGEATGGEFTFLATPTVSSISPVPAGPNDTLEIKGSNLNNIQQARFGSNNPPKFGTLIYAADTLLRIPVKAFSQSPLVLLSGTYQVPLPSPGFQYVAKPGIDSVRPMVAAEGMEVKIYGNHFDFVSAISFGGVSAKSFARKDISGSEPMFAAYPGNGSPGLIEVTNNLGKGRFNGFIYTYKPILTKVNYTEIGAKDTIRVTGGNLHRINTVLFGGVPVKYFEAGSKNLLKIVVGSGLDEGAYDLQLIGEDTVLQAGKLKYFLPEIPVFTKDTIAYPGKMIKITAKKFIPIEGKTVVEVWFGNVVVANTPEDGDSILFVKIPKTATDINFRVVTRYAEGYFNRMQLKWPCIIDSVKPGLAEPGNLITVYGKNLAGVVNDPRLFLADILVNPETVSDNMITFKMPQGSTGGDLRISVNGYTEEFSDAVHGKFTAINTTISRNRFSAQWLPKNLYNSSSDVYLNFIDLDNDGKPEFLRLVTEHAINSPTTYKIVIRKNISTPDSVMFDADAALNLPSGWSPAIEFGDLDNDGSTDILVFNSNDRNPATVRYFYTNLRLLNGAWTADLSIKKYPTTWLDAAIGDINHDGLNDILVGSSVRHPHSSDEISYNWDEVLHLDLPWGSYWPTELLKANDRERDFGLPVNMTHLRNRNAPDFELSGVNYTQQTQPFSNQTILTKVPLGFVSGWTGNKLEFADLNNDGARDCIGFDDDYGTFGKAFWNLKPVGNNPLFKDPIGFDIGKLSIESLKVADFNGDGKKDLVVITRSADYNPELDSMHFLERTGNVNAFQFVKRSYLFEAYKYWGKRMSAIDMNGDGKTDLVFRAYDSQNFSYHILLNKIGSSDEISVCNGQDAPLLVAGKNGSSYQWQSSSGNSYVNLADAPGIQGALTGSLQLSNITLAQHNLSVRCLVDGVPAQGYVIKVINRWVGLVGNNADWHNPLNWSCGTIPDADTHVLIDGAEVLINNDATCKSLELRNNAKVHVTPNTKLTIVK